MIGLSDPSMIKKMELEHWWTAVFRRRFSADGTKKGGLPTCKIRKDGYAGFPFVHICTKLDLFGSHEKQRRLVGSDNE